MLGAIAMQMSVHIRTKVIAVCIMNMLLTIFVVFLGRNYIVICNMCFGLNLLTLYCAYALFLYFCFQYVLFLITHSFILLNNMLLIFFSLTRVLLVRTKLHLYIGEFSSNLLHLIVHGLWKCTGVRLV